VIDSKSGTQKATAQFVEDVKSEGNSIEERKIYYSEEESKFTLRKLYGKYARNVISAIEGNLLKFQDAPKWDTLIVHDSIKKQVVGSVVEPLKKRSKEASIGLLLYGPKGNGKSIIAKTLATHFGPALIFFSFASNDFNTEAAVSAIFEASMISQPSIILINEIDELLNNDSVGKKTFLKAMNYTESKYRGQILVVGVTNQPFGIDEKVLEKFRVRIYVPLPDIEQRIIFIKKELEKLNDEQCKHLAEITEYFSFHNLKTLCEEMKKKIKVLTFENLVEAGLNKVEPTASLKTVEEFQSWNKATNS
jgi:SpoVK/Ycf46/Vps4 family AAA+-type ATPase